MTTAYITDTRFAAHTLAGHSEYAGRLTSIQELLEREGLPAQMIQMRPDPATEAQLRAIHTDEYLDNILAWTETQRGVQLGPDTYVLPQSYGVAKLSAGASILGVDVVMSGKASNALVAARPPGHHAVRDMGMGFCLLANVAIAAEHARRQYGIQRILIVDYDVHHGNGTHDIFYEDPGMLFISTHRFPHYPGSGKVEETGRGAGVGATINIPFPAQVGDQGYTAAFDEIILPAAWRFKPELIIVSAGFDAHWADPLSGMGLTLGGYAHITRQLIDAAQSLCDGKIVFVLEGGYNLTSLSHGVLNVAYALLGNPTVSDPLGKFTGQEPDVQALLKRIKTVHHLNGK